MSIASNKSKSHTDDKNSVEIEHTYASDENILIITSDKKLWIMGDNFSKKTGFGKKNEPLYSPVFTGITLKKNEQIKKFHSYSQLIIIYTTIGRLFCSNNQHTPGGEYHRPSHNTSLLRSGRSHLNEESDSGETNESDESDESNESNESDESNESGEINGSGESGESNASDESDSVDSIDSIDENSSIEDNGISESERNYLAQIIFEDSPEFISQLKLNSINNKSSDLSKWSNLNAMEDANSINIDFFDKMSEGQKNIYSARNVANGYTLVSNNVTDVVITFDTIIFRKNGKLYLFDLNPNMYASLINKNLGLSMGYIENGLFPYYELIMPNNITNFIFGPKCVYGLVDDCHHILYITRDSNLDSSITWIYFKSDEDLKNIPENIHIDTCNSTLYIQQENSIFKYVHYNHTLIPYTNILQDPNQKIKNIILSDNCDESVVLIRLTTSGLFLDMDSCGTRHTDRKPAHKKICKYDDTLPYFIDFNAYPRNINLILINSKFAPKYTINENVIYFNVNDFLYYKLTDEGLIYYDRSNTLYYFTYLHIESNRYDTIEIDKIMVENIPYYIYMFVGTNIFESDPINNTHGGLEPTSMEVSYTITDIIFTNNLIVIKSGNRCAYHTIDTEQFIVNKFTEIFIEDSSKKSSMISVSKNHIVYQNRKFDSAPVDMFVNNESTSKFKKFLGIMESIRGGSDFTIKYINKNKVISYGDGPKREFLETAVLEFASEYMLQKNVCTYFNSELMGKFNSDELYCIGLMLHTVICHTKNHLPFRLPISLLIAIKGRPLTKAELEYFAQIEDPEIYNNVKPFGKNPDKFKSCKSDFESYEELLSDLCGIIPKDSNNEIVNNIAKGILKYSKIKNLYIMDYPTLDYYFSGDYVIDRTTIIKNLNINNAYKDFFVNIIQTLPEKKLSILLRNWSGTTVVKKSCVYKITILKKQADNDILFTTCSVTMNIQKKLLDDLEMRSTLSDLLCIPITTMVDK